MRVNMAPRGSGRNGSAWTVKVNTAVSMGKYRAVYRKKGCDLHIGTS